MTDQTAAEQESARLLLHAIADMTRGPFDVTVDPWELLELIHVAAKAEPDHTPGDSDALLYASIEYPDNPRGDGNLLVPMDGPVGRMLTRDWVDAVTVHAKFPHSTRVFRLADRPTDAA